MSFGWVISHKVWESYAWSKLSWLFLQTPNLATYGSWWIMSNPWWIMINPCAVLNQRRSCERLLDKWEGKFWVQQRAFDESKRTVHGEVDLPIKVGSQIFNSTFYIVDIRPAYSCLLGLPWIHGARAVTSTLHRKLKYPVKGRIVTICSEEEFMLIHLNSFKYELWMGRFS